MTDTASDILQRSTGTAPTKSTSSISNESKSKATKLDPKETNIAEIERIVGFIKDEYNCVHNNFSGTLYAGPNAVYFLGRIFFFEWKVVIKWVDVLQVLKGDDHTISIAAYGPKDRAQRAYDFKFTHNTDRVWTSLVTFQNESILDSPRKGDRANDDDGAANSIKSPQGLSRGLRRMNSDPLRLSQLTKSLSRGFEIASPSKMTNAAVGSMDASTKSTAYVSSRSSTQSGTENEAFPNKPDLQRRWSEASESETRSFSTAVKNHEVPCSLDTFVDLFVKDGAMYSIAAHMRDNGDDDIKQSPWQDEEAETVESDNSIGGEHSQHRSIEYTHPVNAPMAPPMARARKEQTLRKFGSHGLILETKTIVSDVPMTDCFYVQDRIRVEPKPGFPDIVTMTMLYDIRFVKSTMFKSIIARTTKGEFEKFMKGLAAYCTDCLRNQNSSADASEGEGVQQLSKDQANEQLGTSRHATTLVTTAPSYQYIVFSGIAVIVFIQLFILWELKSLKLEMRQLHTERWLDVERQLHAEI